MPIISGLPPELKRLASVYDFIPYENFAELGIDPDDVPLGSFPAHKHPPFLPDRFGGNAYGLGLFEYSALSEAESRLLGDLDFSDRQTIVDHHTQLNNILKRLGLLVRVTSLGRIFYLIPRQYIIHFSTEIQAKADWIEQNLKDIEARERARIGVVANQADLLLSELQVRLPRFNFVHIDSLDGLRDQPYPLQAFILLEPPTEINFLTSAHKKSGYKGEEQLNVGFFTSSMIHALLDKQGLLLIACDSPGFDRNATIKVKFDRQDEYKRFLLFSHIYRTKRRYWSRHGLELEINASDFYTFITAQGLYYEILESMLEGRPLPQVTPPEIDALPFQDIPLPRSSGGSAEQQAYLRECFSPFFELKLLHTILPDLQKKLLQDNYHLESELPHTLLVGQASPRQPTVDYQSLAARPELKFLIGCPPELLAPYKNTFSYLLKTLQVVKDINQKNFPGLNQREQRMLLGAFQTDSAMAQDAKRLVEMIPLLSKMEARLNPHGVLGMETTVLENLEKLGFWGFDAGVLGQIYLTVLGHSSLGRVCLGKLSEQTLAPLVEVKNYRSLEEAISTINLCRLFSFAETVSSDYISKHPNLMAEIFAMSLNATRVLTDPYTNWEDIEREREKSSGGLKSQVVAKLLKLLNLFDFLNNWPNLVQAGPYQQEVLTNFEAPLQERAGQVMTLYHHIRHFLEFFHADNPHSRPYFFRALLACHVHGVSRLLPRLGAKAAFNLLWVCVHVSDLRVINLNWLPNPHHPQQISKFNMLRHNLEALSLESMSPGALNSLRQDILQKKEAYLSNTGIFFTVDEQMKVLAPGFLDPRQTMQELEWESGIVVKQSLERFSGQQLSSLNQAYSSLARYFKAVQGSDDAQRFGQVKTTLLRHTMNQLLDLPAFAFRLKRLQQCCPIILDDLLYKNLPDKPATPLMAASKLDALLQDRLDQFQNMQLSYEAAVAEFGSSATGIVGVSKLQFAYLAQKLQHAINSHPALVKALILSILLAVSENPHGAYRSLEASGLYKNILSEPGLEESLRFLLTTHNVPWQMIAGEAPAELLEPLLTVEDNNLLNISFLLSVIHTASRKEGFLNEDLLEQFLILWRRLERWRSEKFSPKDIIAEELSRQQMFYEALQKYSDESSALHVMPKWDDLALMSPVPNSPSANARTQAAMNRLLRICGFSFIEATELSLYKNGMHAAFIYRNKRLHARGPTGYRNDLEAALNLDIALNYHPSVAAFILRALSDYKRPLLISHFAEAAAELSPLEKINLLALGLAAVMRTRRKNADISKLSFKNLANLSSNRLNLLKYVLRICKIEKLVNPAAQANFYGYAPGIILGFDMQTVSLDLADLARMQQIADKFATAANIEELKTWYKEEVLKASEILPEMAHGFKEQLHHAFLQSLNRLTDSYLDQARLAMGKAKDIASLNALLPQYANSQNGLPEERINMLNDLYAMNVERIHSDLIIQTAGRLSSVHNLDDLDNLWHEIMPRLRDSNQAVRDNSLILSLAAFFDRRARELAH